MGDSLTEEQMRRFEFVPSIDGKRGPITRLLCAECIEFIAEWDYRQTFSLKNAVTMAMEHIDVCAPEIGPGEEFIECPYCRIKLRSYRHDDPLKHHIEYCEAVPDECEKCGETHFGECANSVRDYGDDE